MDRGHGSDANAQADGALIQGTFEDRHQHLVQDMRQSIDFEARRQMVSEVNDEVVCMRSAMHFEYQAAVFSEKRELYSEFQDRFNQREMAADAIAQVEMQMVQVERRAMQVSQQRLGGEQSDELRKLRLSGQYIIIWTYESSDIFATLRRITTPISAYANTIST